MKILGYDVRPIHAVYVTALAALAAVAPGCGSEPYDYESRATRHAYEAIHDNMKLHGRLNHPGKWSAVLLKSANRDYNMTNELTLNDLQWLIDEELKQGNKIHGWPEDAASEKSEPAEKAK